MNADPGDLTTEPEPGSTNAGPGDLPAEPASLNADPGDLPEDEAASLPGAGQQRRIPGPLRWLAVVGLVVVALFCSGQIALRNPFPGGQADTRSRLTADYGRWPYTPLPPVNPGILDDIAHDLAQESASGTAALPQLGDEVDLWSALGLASAPTSTAAQVSALTATPTQTDPGPPPTATPVPPTNTAAPTAAPTRTPAPTSTRVALPTATPSPTPTATPTGTATPSASPLPPTEPVTPFVVPTDTSPPPTASSTATPTPTPTATLTLTVTATATASNTATVTPTHTATPTRTPTATNTQAPCSGDPPPGTLSVIAPDGAAFNLACGQSYIVDLIGMGGTSIVTPHDGFDLIFYEWPAAPGIQVDWVIVAICPDPACATSYTIFNWGDAAADLNTNIGAAYGPPEDDNHPIPSGDLFGSPPFQTGIAIDVDPVAPAGVYPYIRLFSPLGGDNDGAQADALVVLATGTSTPTPTPTATP